MRIALRENEDYEVTLAKEIETLQLYLDIQRIRFAASLTLTLILILKPPAPSYRA